jgi:uncharacterized protein YjiK
MTALRILVGLICIFTFAGSSAAMAQDELAFARQVRVFENDQIGELHPLGLAFSPQANRFLVLEAAAGQPSNLTSSIVEITPSEERGAALTIPSAVVDAINLAFDSKANRLLLFEAVNHALIEINAGADGKLAPETLTRQDAQHFGLQNAQGMAVDLLNGHLYILDSAGPRLVHVEPESDGSFDQAKISAVDLQPTGLVNPRGLAWDPTSGHLHVLEPDTQRLYELTQSGEVVTTRDLSEMNLGKLQGMVFAPSGDQTDAPEQMSLYLSSTDGQTDGSLGNEQFVPGENALYMPQITGGVGNGNATEQTTGQITELTFSAPAIVTVASTFQSSLIRTVDMSRWNPPSPDPSGIAYLGGTRLIMVDGEVEEKVGKNKITHFQGANVWEFSLTGTVLRTANISTVAPTVVRMTDEPTGVAWVPDNASSVPTQFRGHFFISNDGYKRVYDLNPGGDGLMGTADDTFTYFSTLANNNNNVDPEGITFGYNGGQPRLWVADGMNREVYEYTLTGTLVRHFDVQQYGVEDPESAEYNPDSGTLFVMSSNRPDPVIAETTLTGALVQMINIAAASPQQAAGIAYAPASNGTNAKRFYIVDRGIDNDSDPNIIDGRMYEMTAPSSSTPVNEPPVASNDSASTLVNTPVSINVVLNDSDPNGNLDPSSATVTTPPAHGAAANNGNGTFTYTPNNGFTGNDTFTYRVCDTDGLCDTATVTITVSNTSSGSDPIFADGFESGNLSAWSASVTDGGDLSASTAAKLAGNYGMQAVIDDNVAIFVTDDTPSAESRYRARFYFDPNSITMVNGDVHFIFYGYSGSSTAVLRVQFRRSSGGYQIRAALRDDGSTWFNTSWLNINDAVHNVELDWQAATGAGANNGHLTVWLDGAQQANLTTVDNDTRRIDRARLGAVAGIDAGTRGTYYFDAFESRRQTFIGSATTAQVTAAGALAPNAAELNEWTTEEALPEEN